MHICTNSCLKYSLELSKDTADMRRTFCHEILEISHDQLSLASENSKLVHQCFPRQLLILLHRTGQGKDSVSADVGGWVGG